MAIRMTRKTKLMLGGLAVLLALALASRVVRIRTFHSDQPAPYGVNRMDERTDQVWQLEDESSVKIARTYLTAADRAATFHIEWEVPLAQLPPASSREALLEVVRPVLRHAVSRRKLEAIEIKEFGVGRVPVMRVRAQIQGSGTTEKRELVTTNMDELYVWNWSFDGRQHRIFGPGYYFDRDSGKVTFTMKWHDATLCQRLQQIDDDAAFALAEPVLRQAAARQLWRVVPLASAKGMSAPRETVDNVGVELGCPDENCTSETTSCRVRGYRVARPLDSLRRSKD